MESHADYGKYQGRSFTLLLVDEAGQFADSALLDIVRSNLRGPADVPIRTVIAANPGGVGHYWLAHRYVFKSAPWTVFDEPKSKRRWVYAPSTFAGNQFIDREQYRDQLEASRPDDPELLKAWVEGDWAVNRGAYFAGCLDEKRNAVSNLNEVPDNWGSYLAHDFGSSAPSATYVCLRSPGDEVDGVWYPRNSIVLADELVTNKPGNLNVGLGSTVPVLAEQIIAMCARWDMRAQGVADDAIFARAGHSTGSIADEFELAGVSFDSAMKADRLSGWNRTRRLLSHAGDPHRPGLYIVRRCEYFGATVPSLPRDPKTVEDVDSTGPDHGADAVRYGCLQEQWATSLKIGWVTHEPHP